MNKLTVLIGLLTFTSLSMFSSCEKDEKDCKLCRYTETDGSTVSMGELCGEEYKTVQNSGFVSSTGLKTVTCE